jgi:hypothetical protein
VSFCFTSLEAEPQTYQGDYLLNPCFIPVFSKECSGATNFVIIVGRDPSENTNTYLYRTLLGA